jgi:6-phosphofructokinase
LREVESGRESAQAQGNILIDKLIRKAIDQSKNEVYNLYHGESDLIEGLIKEINNGSI